MKKELIVACLSLLLLTGCGSEKTMKCTRTLNQSGLKFDLSYEVTYKGNVVSKVHSVEKITSETEDLELYKEQVEKTYAPYTDIEYYDTNVTIDGDVLTSTADIDYSKIDVDKMIEVDSANQNLFKDGKVHLDDITSIYEAAGATCEK